MPELEIQDLDLCFLWFPGHLGRAQNPHAAAAVANYHHRAPMESNGTAAQAASLPRGLCCRKALT